MDSSFSHLSWIDSQETILLERVKKWASINTYSWNTAGLAEFLHLLQKEFSVLGGEVFLHDLPTLSRRDPSGKFINHSLGQAMTIRKRPDAKIKVFLGGHMDTVYSPSSPFQMPFMIKEDICGGPGVADMKGGLAILLTALEAFERFPFAKNLGWEILLSPDEEIGSPGSAPLYRVAAKRNHYGLIFEPSFPDGAFVSQRKGSATCTIVVRGKPAHVGRDFEVGRSAVFALARFIHKAEFLLQEKGLTVNVTDIEGKGPVNIVPSLASCWINLRSDHVEQLEMGLLQLKTYAKACETEGIQVEIIQENFRKPKPFSTETQKLFELYSSCSKELHIPFHTRPTGGVCDGNILEEEGLPSLDTAGAVGGSLHTEEEYIICSSLVERAKLASLFLMKIAFGEHTNG